MIIPGGVLEHVGTGIVIPVRDVLNGNRCRGRDHTMVVPRAPAVIVGIGITAVGGQNVVKVKDCHVVVGVIVQPIVDQPVVKGARIVRVGLILPGRGCDHHEQFVRSRAKVLQDVVVDSFGIANGVMGRIERLTAQRVLTNRRRIVRIPLQVGVGVAGLEHDNLVLTAGVGHRTSVVGVLVDRSVQRAQICATHRAAKPVPPVPDVRI